MHGEMSPSSGQGVQVVARRRRLRRRRNRSKKRRRRRRRKRRMRAGEFYSPRQHCSSNKVAVTAADRRVTHAYGGRRRRRMA